MRVFSLVGALAMALCSLAHAQDQAKVSRLDATGGNIGDHQIVYVANANSADSTVGTALIVLKNAGKQEAAYGLFMDGETDKVGNVDEKLVAAMSKKEDPKANIITVDVTADQYTKAGEILETYASKKEILDPPADVVMNCGTEVLAACGMKPSYRSALRAPNPTQWFGDIPMNNRKLAVE